jgi:MoaA/NifB/PqqE/SkfB family radical SAM enzyme
MTTLQSVQLREFLSRTGNLLIHLSDRCNLQCKHCYLSAAGTGETMLPPDLVRRTLCEAHELGLDSVQLSGGEPLLYPDIRRLLNDTRHKRFKVSLSTNATLIDDGTADLLADIGADVVASIDGPAPYHDSFRAKPGCFEKAAAGIERLVQRGVRVKMVTTVCRDNLAYIDWCAAWASGMQADTLQFQPLESVGRGQAIESLRLTYGMLHELFIHLSDLAVKYKDDGLKISMTYQSRDHMLAHPCKAFVCNGKKCHRGVEKELKKIVIREDGVILPELVDIDRRYAIGNLYQDTLTNNLCNFLQDGYSRFDKLCRYVYHQTVPTYPSPLIPWNEILSEQSRSFTSQ